MKIGVIGSGVVGQTLAAGFLKHGHEVTLGRATRENFGWRAAHSSARTRPFAEAAGFGELVVLAVAGEVALAALKLAGAEALDGKVVIDACNPIGGGPPVNGVLHFFTDDDDLLMERLQSAFPQARFVKAFNSVGAAQMVNPVFAGGRPTMFICGGDADGEENSRRAAGSVRLGHRGHGRGRSGARHRAALHVVVHSRPRPRRLVAACVQAFCASRP